jgi:selenide,water dikinase
VKRLVLCGGGHSHLEVLRRFGRDPAKDVELVLVSPHRRTPYSGMLPGLVAGHYTFEASHVELEPLAHFARARVLPTLVTTLDPAARTLGLADGTRLEFDLASLDIGSTPATAGIPGAAEHALAVKPVERFLRAWSDAVERSGAGALRRGVVVGGGAAGIELVLAMQHRIGQATGRRGAVEWQLVTDVDVLLPSHCPRARAIFERVLGERGIAVHRARPVARVEPGGVRAADGSAVAGDLIVWATGAGASPWLAASGLAVDDRGFVAVDETLRSVSHPHVFAAGDCASVIGHPRPKSGVYAVRQGPPLAANLRWALAGGPLERYRPQVEALALISTGDRYAVATRGAWALEGRWVWWWKDWIDRRFMTRYERLSRL